MKSNTSTPLLPFLSLSEWQNQLKARTRPLQQASGLAEPLQHIRSPSNVDVRKPYYIDRFKQNKARPCASECKCLACEGAHPQTEKFRLTMRRGQGHRGQCKSKTLNSQTLEAQAHERAKQRSWVVNQRSEHAETERMKELAQQELARSILQRIRLVSQQTRLQFTQKTGLSCEDPEAVRMFALFLKQYASGKTGKGNFELLDMKDILVELSQLDMNALLRSQEFIEMFISGQASLASNTSCSDFGSGERRSHKKLSIKLHSMADQKAQRNLTSNFSPATAKHPKKVRMQATESDSEAHRQKALEIFTVIFIDNQQCESLNHSVKQRLRQFVNSENKKFNGALKQLIGIIASKISKKQLCNEIVLKRLNFAIGWMKNCLHQKDQHADQKKRRLDKMITTIKSIDSKAGSNGKKSSRSRQRSKLANDTETDSINQSERGKTRSNRRKAQQDNDGLLTDRKSNKSRQGSKPSSSKNINPMTPKSSKRNGQPAAYHESTQKLIKDEMEDQFDENVTPKVIETKKFEKKTSILRKVSSIRHSKAQQPEWSLRSLMKKESLDIISKQSILAPTVAEKQNVPEKRVGVSPHFGLLRAETLILEKEPPEKRRRVILKIKAAEHLKHNFEIITSAEEALRSLNLGEYVINPEDSVLTQKKKIRGLRELIRVRSSSRQLEQELVNQIRYYLLVYEESCNILIDNTAKPAPKEPQQPSEPKLDRLIGRAEIFDDLMFYDLNQERHKGHDDDLQFIGHQMHKARLEPRKTADKIISHQKKPSIYKIAPLAINKQSDQDLMQVQVQQRGEYQRFLQSKYVEPISRTQRNTGEPEQKHQSIGQRIQKYLTINKKQRSYFQRVRTNRSCQIYDKLQLAF